MRKVYVDHGATTPVRQEVIDEITKYYGEKFGNPSSVYSYGREAKQAIEKSREQVAKIIGSKPEEIYFCGSGTEADNWAIIGTVLANKNKGNHIITTKTEHHAVLHTCEYLEKQGFKVTYLSVDENGMISLDELEKSITDKTIIITIMHANNEIGTIQPIDKIGEIAKEKGVYFHTDAVQSIGKIPIDVNNLNIDLLSLSAHKIYGPKGIGALYIKKGIKIDPYIHGGGQERKKRAGTENVAGIVGLGKAIELIYSEMEKEISKLKRLRDRYIKLVTEKISNVKLNGHPINRLPNNANISFEFIEGESLLLNLDMKGICASSGSACTSGSLDPSHVLLAIGLPHEIAHGSLRVTFGKDNTEEDVEFIVEQLVEIVERLRKMSPLYKEGGNKNV